MRWLCLVALIGCGRLGFGTIAGDGGSSDDGAAARDAVDAMITTSSVCPPTAALSDDFNATTMSPAWTSAVGTNMTIVQTGGFLQIAFGTGTTPAGTRSGYTQTAAIDYTESCSIVELDTIPAVGAMGSVSVQVGDSGAYVTFEEASGTLYSDRKGGLVDTRPYDPVAHKFLRLRQHAGTWYWEASADATTYMTIASVASFVPNPTTITLEVVAVGGTQNGGMADFNSVQVLVP